MLQSTIEHRPAYSSEPFFLSPRQPKRREVFAEAGVEPALSDLLSDPLTTILMRRDGVSLESLQELLAQTRAILKSR